MNQNLGALANALRGPLILITVGILFVLNNFTRFQFSETWPAILIVVGAISLIGYGRRNDPEGRTR